MTPLDWGGKLRPPKASHRAGAEDKPSLGFGLSQITTGAFQRIK